jgi:hypothetical protein
LTVRDDGQRFERWSGQALRTHRHLRALDRLGVLGTREDLPTAALLDDFYAMSIDIVVLAEFIEGSRHGGRTRFRIECGQCLERDGARRGKQGGFKQLR